MESTFAIPEIFNFFAFFLLASFIRIVNAELAFRGKPGVNVLSNVLSKILRF